MKPRTIFATARSPFGRFEFIPQPRPITYPFAPRPREVKKVQGKTCKEVARILTLYPGRTVSAICQHTDMTHKAVLSALERMYANGSVTRTGTCKYYAYTMHKDYLP